VAEAQPTLPPKVPLQVSEQEM